jgi:cytoskeletal protein RodZ
MKRNRSDNEEIENLTNMRNELLAELEELQITQKLKLNTPLKLFIILIVIIVVSGLLIAAWSWVLFLNGEFILASIY